MGGTVATTAFGICLIISLFVMLWMSSKEYENIDRYYWTVVTLIPIVILGYWLKTMTVTPEAAAIAFCFIYIDSTVLLTIMIFLMLRTIGVRVKPWIKYLAYGVAGIHLFVVWGSVHNNIYFGEISIIKTAWGNATKLSGGPLRIYHYIYLGIIMAVIVGILLAGYLRKGLYSRRGLMVYSVLTVVCMVMYIIEWAIDIDFSLLPFLYVTSDILIAIQYDRIHMHDLFFVEAEHQRKHGDHGLAVFDTDGRFLCANRRMMDFWPALSRVRIDEKLSDDDPLRLVFYSMMEACEIRGERTEKFRIGDMTCVCEISPVYLKKGDDSRGWVFDVRDATEEQKNLDIINSYNDTLNAQVRAKTRDIIEMQRKIVTGMANMIENRDNNTGGHVKRTSDIISIIIDEIRAQKTLDIDDAFANDIVRAAPTHDLGKITIENAILNKPAKLTDEEYEIMKTHAQKSGEMVMILLDGVEEEHFVKIAYNVARYHHERWDGRGYPEGLVGSMIPVEARIMAVADVYDALACKRSYKEAMDPGLVAKLMIEGMGTQFDPELLPVFIGCRKKLEEYYHKENTR